MRLAVVLLVCFVTAQLVTGQYVNINDFKPLASAKVSGKTQPVAISDECLAAAIQWYQQQYPNQITMTSYSGASFNDVGSSDQCEAIENAHYCSALVTFADLGLGGGYGLCAPKACTGAELEDLQLFGALQTSRDLAILAQLSNTTLVVSCLDEQVKWTHNRSAVAIISFIFIFGGLTCLAGLAHCLGLINAQQPKAKVEDAEDLSTQRFPAPSPVWACLRRLLSDFNPQINLSKLVASTPTIHGAPGSTFKIHLDVLNGIRVLSMVWVILGHTLFFPQQITRNLEYVFAEVSQRWTFSFIVDATFSVDTFFFLSGFLAAFLMVKDMQKQKAKLEREGKQDAKGYMRWVLFFVHRYLRLTPVYFMWLVVHWKVVPALASQTGPLGFLQQDGRNDGSNCDQYWWTNMLYINNFWPRDFGDSCMGWTWYLANDWQLSFLLPLILIPYNRKKLYGWLVGGSVLAAAWIVSAAIAFHYHFDPGLNATTPNAKYNTYFYVRPYTRAAPYLLGILMALLLDAHLSLAQSVNDRHHQTSHYTTLSEEAESAAAASSEWIELVSKPKKQHNQTTVAAAAALPVTVSIQTSATAAAATTTQTPLLSEHQHEQQQQQQHEQLELEAVPRVPFKFLVLGWVLAAFLLLGTVLGPYQLNKDGADSLGNWSQATKDMYIAFARTGWTLGLALLVYPMLLGEAQMSSLRAVLSHAVFTPLARLTYQAYLCHPILIILSTYTGRYLLYYSDMLFVNNFLGYLLGAYAIALVGYLWMEKPIMNLEARLLGRG